MVLKEGMVIRHHSGRVYSVLCVANMHGTDRERFPVTVVYRGANGHVWSRPASEFEQKFTVLFDGTNLSNGYNGAPISAPGAQQKSKGEKS